MSLICNKKKVILFFIWAVICIVALVCTMTYNGDYFLSLIISLVLAGVLISFFILKKDRNLFEPIMLFSYLYIFVPIVTWYYLITDFDDNPFIDTVKYTKSFSSLFDLTVFLFFIGYVLCLGGYYLIKQKKKVYKVTVQYEDKKTVGNFALDIIIVLCYVAGIANFLYNVLLCADGSIIGYLSSLGNGLEEAGGTTICYNFLIFGNYLWAYRLTRNKKNINVLFVVGVIATIVILATSGRIFSTIVNVAILASIFYLSKYESSRKKYNRKIILLAVGLCVIGLLFYIFRAIIGLQNNGLLNNFTDTFKSIGSNLTYYVFDKGNVPNLAIVPKILDGWGASQGYLYGASIIEPLTNILPSELSSTTYATSVIVRHSLFYEVENSGNLPTTCIGEFYVNFGYIGIIVGMFAFGMFLAILYNLLTKKKVHFWSVVIYSIFGLNFIMIFSKVDFSNIPVWEMFYLLVFVFCVYVFSAVIRWLTDLKKGRMRK